MYSLTYTASFEEYGLYETKLIHHFSLLNVPVIPLSYSDWKVKFFFFFYITQASIDF